MADTTTDRARRQELLDAMRAQPGDWTTGTVVRFHTANGWGCLRSVARTDLRRLVADGLVTEHGPQNGRVYRLNLTRDPRLGHGWQTPAQTPNRATHRPSRRR
ncbi:hypothetical protein [Streptomyces sp. NPDC048242]|uniref:hypothetical protein n=1 Tax=Streptomyces sp. NPDC048242 TaxID=3155026 RepID=UPI003443BB6B